MSVDPKLLAEENATLRAQIATLRLRKPRQDAASRTKIDSALECLDLIESGQAAENDLAGYFDMIRRVLQAEREAYTTPAE